ncbi:MAG: hypothetical protein J3Q66DRAFT_392674 [Benniella sp.]|nr:MAG: hypothetical protein J3Q66DRAFT_392674 [Benniella sp.]
MRLLFHLPAQPRHYILVDELQFIFKTPYLLRVAKAFFESLSSPAVSYVGAGTFQLRDLLDDDGFDSFNKAAFAQMAPFDLMEMGKLFRLYKQHCDPHGISPEIQARIAHESGGHPASFMVLLKLTLQRRPDTNNWANVLDNNIRDLLNGTHLKLEKELKALPLEQKALVRELTKNQLDVWGLDPQAYFIRDLLNVGLLDSSGILNSAGKTNVRFTSGIILRICINVVWPRPMDRLSSNEVANATNVLEVGLRNTSPSTVVHPLVQGKYGPQENAFQAALYAAFNGLLPIDMKCLFEAKAKDRATWI